MSGGEDGPGTGLSEFDVRRLKLLFDIGKAPAGDANSHAFMPKHPAEFMAELIDRARLPQDAARSARERIEQRGMLLDGRTMAGGFNDLKQVLTKAGHVVARRRRPEIRGTAQLLGLESMMPDAAALALINRQRPGLAPELLYSDGNFMVTRLVPGVHPVPKPKDPGERWHHRWAHESLPGVLPGLVADISTVRLPETLLQPSRIRTPVRMMDRVRTHVAHPGQQHGSVFRSLGYTVDLVDRLRGFAAAFTPRVGATHNDLHPFNLLVQRRSDGTTSIRALDWDAICAGDPLADLIGSLFRTAVDESRWREMAADLERRLLPDHPDQGRGIQADFPQAVAVGGVIKAAPNIKYAAELVSTVRERDPDEFAQALDNISGLIAKRLRPARRLLYGEDMSTEEVQRRLTTHIPRNPLLIAIRGLSPLPARARKAETAQVTVKPSPSWIAAFKRAVVPEKQSSLARSLDRTTGLP